MNQTKGNSKQTIDAKINIISSTYSNMVNIQASQNDIALDFMSLPPIQRNGEVTIDGIRVYLTHEQARQLSTLINTTLEKVTEGKKI